MRTFLVTGGAGFIGSHIAEALVARGDRVRVLDNLSTGHLSNLDGFRERIEFIEGDLIDARLVAEAVAGRRLRLPRGGAGLGAAERRAAAGYPRRLRDRHGDAAGRRPAGRRAARGLRRLQQRLRRPADQLASARPTCPPRSRPTPPPSWPASTTARRSRPPTASRRSRIRYFNVFGPRQDPNSHYSAVIPLFITAMLAGRQPVIYGDGRQSRDFTYVANVVHANLLAADAPGVAGRMFNVANGRSDRPADADRRAQPPAGHQRQAASTPPPRRATSARAWPTSRQARRLLGYEPQVDFEEGLRRSIDYYRQLATKTAQKV